MDVGETPFWHKTMIGPTICRNPYLGITKGCKNWKDKPQDYVIQTQVDAIERKMFQTWKEQDLARYLAGRI